LIVPVFFLASAFVKEGVEAAQALQERIASGQLGAVEQWRDWLVKRAPFRLEGMEGAAREQAQRVAAWLASKAAAIARNIATFLFEFIVTLLAMFYFFRDGPRVVDRLRGIIPLEAEHRDSLLRRIRELVQVTIRSSFVVAGMQGVIGGLLFWAVGISSPIFWGVVIGFLGLLPLIGPWLIWLPAGIVLLAQGDAVRGIVVLFVGAGVISMVDNVVRPALIGTSARLSGLLIFISVLGGIAAFGMLGLVLGPILVVCAVSLIETYAERPAAQTARPSPG
jgi:predicted PurR-regulated permease PerM